jgi:hypothetical protein
MRARETARAKACQENLQKIDAAKEQWALEMNLSNGSAIDDTFITDAQIVGPEGYIKKTPICPANGVYTVNPIGSDPVCDIARTINATNKAFWHELP